MKDSLSSLKFIPVLSLLIAGILFSQKVHSNTIHVAVTNNVFTPASVTIHIGDTVVWTNTQGNHNVNGDISYFPSNPASFSNPVAYNWTYSFVFTLPGIYNYQCDPHAGIGMLGVVIVEEESTAHKIGVNFSNMDVYAGKELFLRARDNSNGEEIGRTKTLVISAFTLEVSGIMLGESYTVDLFADLNGNGRYDAPPVDDAWSLELLDVTGDQAIDFSPNDRLSDILWQYKLSMNFTGMEAGIGKMFKLLIRDPVSGETVDSLQINSVNSAEFSMYSYAIVPGESYLLDFFADLNGSGSYNPPPIDNAWRIQLAEVINDTIVDFTYNTDFTDIFPSVVSTSNFTGQGLNLYPNPAGDRLRLIMNEQGPVEISIYNLNGQLLGREEYKEIQGEIILNTANLKPGIYLLKAKTESKNEISRFVIR